MRTALTVLVVAAASIYTGALSAAPAVTSVAASPSSIPAGAATSVTVTAIVTDSSLIPGSINLQRRDSGGTLIAILGTLHDDGLNGDLVAGDKTFTLQVSFNEAAPGTVFLKVSAAFSGLPVRGQSANLPLTITSGPVLVDTTPPSISITPSNSTTVATKTPTITVSYGDVDSGIDPSTFSVTLDGNNVSGQFTAGSSSANGQLTLTEAPHTIVAKISDRAGNQGQATSTFTVTLADVTPPSVSITPANGATVSTKTPTITVSYSDAGSGIDPATFLLTVDGNNVSGQFTAGVSSATGQLTLTETSHTIVAKISDHSGNQGQATSTFTVADITPPVISITPANSAIVSTTSPQIQISYTDAVSGVDTATFTITIDGINYAPQFTIGSTGATAQPTLSGGQHVIVVNLKDHAGNLATSTSTFTIASFQSLPMATPTSGPIPLTVKFHADGVYTDGAITRWRWDFQGDGIFDTDDIGPLDYTRTFTQTGVFNAKLELTNSKGQVTFATVTITATNPLPTATASVDPSNGGTPLSVNFTGSGSSATGTIVKYEWDFQGDGIFDYTSTTTGNTSFTYSQPGTFSAVFRVTDSFNQTATAVVTATAIRVGPAGSPTATITTPSGPVTGNAPLARSFNGTGTASSGRTIAKYEWDFDGNGVYDFTSTTTASTNFTYSTPGVYTAAFRVTDNTGATGIDTVDITVNITTSLTLSTDTLRTSTNGTVNVNTSLGGTTPVTIFLKNKGGQTVRTLVNNVTRNAGNYVDTWDGKDGSGNFVPDGSYFAILQYKVGPNTVTLDLTDTANTTPIAPSWTSKLSASGQSCTFTFFSCKVNPFNDDFFEADFTLSQALELTLDIRQINTTIEIVKLFDRIPFGRSIPYNLFWDGTDATGKALQTPSSDGYLFGLIGYRYPANGLYVENRPVLSNITATPNYFDPSTGDFISPNNPTTKIAYTLSKPATLSLQVFRSGPNILMRTITQAVSSGAGTIDWDGRADNGIFVDSGDYHIALKAVDAAGNQSVVRYTMVRVFY